MSGQRNGSHLRNPFIHAQSGQLRGDEAKVRDRVGYWDSQRRKAVAFTAYPYGVGASRYIETSKPA